MYLDALKSIGVRGRFDFPETSFAQLIMMVIGMVTCEKFCEHRGWHSSANKLDSWILGLRIAWARGSLRSPVLLQVSSEAFSLLATYSLLHGLSTAFSAPSLRGPRMGDGIRCHWICVWGKSQIFALSCSRALHNEGLGASVLKLGASQRRRFNPSLFFFGGFFGPSCSAFLAQLRLWKWKSEPWEPFKLSGKTLS